MKISLKDLLAFVGFCAVLLACASYVGFDNPMFWITVGGCAWMSAAFISAAMRAPNRTPKSLLLFLVLGFILASLTLIANAIILLIGGAKLAREEHKTLRKTLAVVAVGVVVSLMIGIAPGIGEAKRLKALQVKYPIVSLADRLRYEAQNRTAGNRFTQITSGGVLLRLNDDEGRLDQTSYGRSRFKRIHDHEAEKFVRSVGFGIGRMSIFMHAPNIEDRPPPRDIRFDEVDRNNRTRDELKLAPLEWLHQDRHDDFLNPSWWGAVIGPKPDVVGFAPHAMHEPRVLLSAEQTVFQMERLELVSLLKFDEPRVYVLDHLPRMDQLAGENVPTRALDAFEAESLPKLRTEEDVVISQDGTNYRMLGSLRAATQCLDCHTAQRGELLGAFSYAIRTGSEGTSE